MTIAIEHRHRLQRLALTGGIGSGKSTALAYLGELGAAVASSDEIVHELYERAEIVAAVRHRFGGDVVGDAGVDRGALARIVFTDEGELAWLEALLHPHVRRTIAEWAGAQDHAAPRPLLVAVEVPLLFEGGFAADFDYSMVITAPAAVRRKRLSAKFGEDDLSRRLAQQMPEEEKLALADFSYLNVGTRRQLRDFLGEAVAHIVAAAAEAERSAAAAGEES
jgi:dephospho-CoA kinase